MHPFVCSARAGRKRIMKWRGPSQQSGLDDEVYLEKKVTEKAQREDVTKRVKDGSK